MNTETDKIIQEVPESDLTSALQNEFKSAPWYVSSLAIHALSFLLLMLIPTTEVTKKHRSVTIVSVPVEDITIVEEEKPIDIVVEDTPTDQTNDNAATTEAPIIITSDFELSDHNETNNDMDNNTAQGDPDNTSTFDGDVTGTPTLMGVGNTGGSGGGGRFGNRIGGGKDNLVAKTGGNKQTEDSVKLGLKWLAEHQEYDGHWDCKKYGGGDNDPAVTGLAVLAFLGAGNSTKIGKYRDNVKRAISWLMSQQTKDGLVGKYRYETGITAMALAEAYGMSDDRIIKESAQRCINVIVKGQCPSGGWDYSPNSIRVDTSVTGWMVMACKSAKISGLDVPYEVFEKALAYMQKATQITNNNGYGGASVSYSTNAPTLDAVVAGGGSTRMTAVALTCFQFLGRDKNDAASLACANQIIADGLPSIETFDLYRWYYASLGLFQLGFKSEYWKKWNEPTKEALLKAQIKIGTVQESKGSWDTAIEQSHGKDQWSRVGETALACLLLEIYYRYAENSGKMMLKH